MATVVITFFLFAPIDVYKMDADYRESKRDHFLPRREQRWSMNSQRLEEIVSELMKPISDVRRSFDTDLCALLEEYLTEAGLHALDAGEGGGAGEAGVGAPNFAELALLLQQSASIYGRRVDFLYQHVLSISDSLLHSTQEIANTSTAEEAETPSPGKRKRKASACAGAGEFSEISVESAAGARREAAPPRPPPTLPRLYLELEPRVLSAADAPLRDYAGEPIGLLTDFHVTWRLHEGLLVDELEGDAKVSSTLRPISLVELQAAIEAAAPPPPPPPATPPPPRTPPPPPPATPPPLCASTPLPEEPAEQLPLVAKSERKRKSNVKIDDVFEGSCKLRITKQIRRKLSKIIEFSLPEKWISVVVKRRMNEIICERTRLRQLEAPPEEGFRGFDSHAADIGGFPGWSAAEAELAMKVSLSTSLALSSTMVPGRCDADSDDDGFFEQSSLGDSDASRRGESPRRTRELGGGVGGVARGRGGARGGGRGARRAGRARAGRRRAAPPGRGPRAPRALRAPAAPSRQRDRRRLQATARLALPGELGQRGDSAGAGALGGFILAAARVGRRAPVLRRRRRGPRRRALPAVRARDTARPPSAHSTPPEVWLTCRQLWPSPPFDYSQGCFTLWIEQSARKTC